MDGPHDRRLKPPGLMGITLVGTLGALPVLHNRSPRGVELVVAGLSSARSPWRWVRPCRSGVPPAGGHMPPSAAAAQSAQGVTTGPVHKPTPAGIVRAPRTTTLCKGATSLASCAWRGIEFPWGRTAGNRSRLLPRSPVVVTTLRAVAFRSTAGGKFAADSQVRG